MKRLYLFLAFLITGSMLLAACGGGGSPSSGGSSSSSGSTDLKAGASGIKDPALIGKWTSADGGSSYEFKDDFTVVSSLVGSTYKTVYNITEGGNGSGKIMIGESGDKVTTWDYKITQDLIELTTPDGRSRRMRKG